MSKASSLALTLAEIATYPHCFSHSLILPSVAPIFFRPLSPDNASYRCQKTISIKRGEVGGAGAAGAQPLTPQILRRYDQEHDE